MNTAVRYLIFVTSTLRRAEGMLLDRERIVWTRGSRVTGEVVSIVATTGTGPDLDVQGGSFDSIEAAWAYIASDLDARQHVNVPTDPAFFGQVYASIEDMESALSVDETVEFWEEVDDTIVAVVKTTVPGARGRGHYPTASACWARMLAGGLVPERMPA